MNELILEAKIHRRQFREEAVSVQYPNCPSTLLQGVLGMLQFMCDR